MSATLENRKYLFKCYKDTFPEQIVQLGGWKVFSNFILNPDNTNHAASLNTGILANKSGSCLEIFITTDAITKYYRPFPTFDKRVHRHGQYILEMNNR